MSQKRESFSSSDAAKEAGISLRQLNYWERIGIVTPRREVFGSREFRRYSPSDVALLRRVKGLIDEGYTLKAASKRVKG